MTRTRQILKFLSIFFVILAATHFYLFERITYYLQLNTKHQIIIGSALASLVIFTVSGLPLSRMFPRQLGRIISWIIYPWMGFALLLLTGFLAADILWLIYNLALPYSSLLVQRDYGLTVICITGILGIYALWNGLGPVRVKPITIHLKKLSPAIDGLRLVQITDLHVGPTLGGQWLRQIVRKVNALQPDIIAITGDLMDGSVAELKQHIAPIEELRAKHGVYFVTGNHEYYSGVKEWCDFLQNRKITVLRNQRVTLTINDNQLDIAGVDDWASRHFPGEGPDLTAALAGRDKTKPVILLAHQPVAMDEAAEQGVDLQLSGHTHGGQIWPFNYLVYLQQPISQGLFLHKNGELQIYVSPGTGFWGPPMRLGTYAEITFISLRSARP